MIAAAGAVKHEEIVEQVKKLFTKLSSDTTSTSQLVAKEPANFTGSEVKRETNIIVFLFWVSVVFRLSKFVFFLFFKLSSGPYD